MKILHTFIKCKLLLKKHHEFINFGHSSVRMFLGPRRRHHVHLWLFGAWGAVQKTEKKKRRSKNGAKFAPALKRATRTPVSEAPGSSKNQSPANFQGAWNCQTLVTWQCNWCLLKISRSWRLVISDWWILMFFMKTAGYHLNLGRFGLNGGRNSWTLHINRWLARIAHQPHHKFHRSNHPSNQQTKIWHP